MKKIAIKKYRDRKGFSLIELLVAMSIFIMVMGAMIAVSVSGFQSYVKSKAIKNVTENVGFAINSIAKDVRMGLIGSTSATASDSLLVTRNRDQKKVCYLLSRGTNDDYLAVNESVSAAYISSCPPYSSDYKKIVNLSGTGMKFDTTSGFRSQKTAPVPNPTVRGWAEINLNIENPSMETDLIRVQTIVSSRDYGWDEL